jgi:acetylornithine/succinyldiaminopimelate/putrescine aminotransferase
MSGSTTSSGATLEQLQELERRYAIGTYARNPVQFVRGSGVRLWDEHGNEYLDFLAGISVLNVGHCHPRVVEAVCEQAGRLTHATNLYYTEPGVLLEPIQGETGINVLSDELLEAARGACDRTGAALVFDEIQSGMGRTGTLWAYEQTGVVPDAITSAKALGGGLPIGALITGERLADVLQPGDHGSTFAGGPVVSSAALVALEICSDPDLLERVQALGERLAAGLEELPYVTRVRGRGLMLAIDVRGDLAAPELARRALLEQRLIVNATGPATIRLEPPLIVSEDQVDEAVARLGALSG